ncbi:MAG TPA: peptide deformylase [Tissierellaceae bacterium]
MALRNIRIDDDPILREVSKPVRKITPRILELLDDMLDTMYDAQGVGLAAPQVGILRRVVVVDIGEGPIKMINPEILEKKGSDIAAEGCLSVPNLAGTVDRPTNVKARYTNIDGEEVIIDAQGFLARAICHELDHLDGILYTDKVIEYLDLDDEEYEEECEE